MTDSMKFIGYCELAEAKTPHGPHGVDISHCSHEIDTWCFGIPYADTVQDQIEKLVEGQRVRVTWEGVVEEPGRYSSAFTKDCRNAVVLSVPGKSDARMVLRYTGDHPAISEDPQKVAGLINQGIVWVEVLPDA